MEKKKHNIRYDRSVAGGALSHAFFARDGFHHRSDKPFWKLIVYSISCCGLYRLKESTHGFNNRLLSSYILCISVVSYTYRYT